MAGEIVHYELGAQDADRAQAFWGGLFGWEFGGEAGDKSPVPGHGWFAACKDTEGNAFHLWQRDSSAGQ